MSVHNKTWYLAWYLLFTTELLFFPPPFNSPFRSNKQCHPVKIRCLFLALFCDSKGVCFKLLFQNKEFLFSVQFCCSSGLSRMAAQPPPDKFCAVVPNQKWDGKYQKNLFLIFLVPYLPFGLVGIYKV